MPPSPRWPPLKADAKGRHWATRPPCATRLICMRHRPAPDRCIGGEWIGVAPPPAKDLTSEAGPFLTAITSSFTVDARRTPGRRVLLAARRKICRPPIAVSLASSVFPL